MKYYLEFTEKAEKQLEKLKDKTLKRNILNKIGELETNPVKGKHIKKNLYELKAKNYRVYYYLYKGIVVIEEIKYLGKVKVTSSND